MTAIEVALLLIGVVFLISSFFITEKLSPADVSKVAALSEEELRIALDRELETAKAKVSDLVDDAMDLTVEQVQRTMEHDTNEKIMAISEYSDTVTEKLEKMNQEVTFLYSMLSDKHTQLTETLDQLNQRMDDYQALMKQPLAELTKESVSQDAAEKSYASNETHEEEDLTVASLQELDTESETANVRAQILEQFKAGADLTDIARDLGIGFGEVKLITELYRGEEES